MIKLIIKWLSNRNKWEQTRKRSDYRATALAVKLVCSGAMQPPRFSSWWRA
ncbi:MAG: hypothetical protein M0T70_02790 [Geobacteraceae bacterium]|nr:hypothetical protein [Geobacteraceae bacterium]